jgi:hypothetical protein
MWIRPPNSALSRVRAMLLNGANQVVLDSKLLKATDTAAKRRKVNRSALIRRPPGNTSAAGVWWNSRIVTAFVVNFGIADHLLRIQPRAHWRIGP